MAHWQLLLLDTYFVHHAELLNMLRQRKRRQEVADYLPYVSFVMCICEKSSGDKKCSVCGSGDVACEMNMGG
jgi:hypothetical protein